MIHSGIRGKIAKIEQIEKRYADQLQDFRKRQQRILAEFRDKLKKKKLDEIKKSIGFP